jgi:hypothetical protein
MRCFPGCYNGHHRSADFCGQAVIVKVTVHGTDLCALAEDQILLVGEFTEDATLEAAAQTDPNNITENAHTGKRPPCTQFKIVSPTSVESVYTLNQNLEPWNYPIWYVQCRVVSQSRGSWHAFEQWRPTQVTLLPHDGYGGKRTFVMRKAIFSSPFSICSTRTKKRKGKMMHQVPQHPVLQQAKQPILYQQPTLLQQLEELDVIDVKLLTEEVPHNSSLTPMPLHMSSMTSSGLAQEMGQLNIPITGQSGMGGQQLSQQLSQQLAHLQQKLQVINS